MLPDSPGIYISMIFKSLSPKLAIFKIIKLFCLLVILVWGAIFSKDAIKEYMRGQTDFHISIEPFTFGDIPVLTICYLEIPCEEEHNATINLKLEVRMDKLFEHHHYIQKYY